MRRWLPTLMEVLFPLWVSDRSQDTYAARSRGPVYVTLVVAAIVATTYFRVHARQHAQPSPLLTPPASSVPAAGAPQPTAPAEAP